MASDMNNNIDEPMVTREVGADGSEDVSRELLELIGAVLNEQETAEQRAKLGEILTNDAEARKVYRRYVNLHVGLKTYGDVSGDSLADRSTIGILTADMLAANDPANKNDGAHGKTWLRTLGIMGTAALLLLGVFLWLTVFNSNNQTGINATENHLAKVTRTAAARWGGERSDIALDSALIAGEIDLLSGFAEITFTNGTTIVMEAPVRLDLLGPDRAKLRMGRVVAHVPPGAEGFTIDTPHAKVIDLGTEFGVGVRESGDTEVQVFRGEVIAEWNGPKGKRVDQHLTEGKALSIEGDTESKPRDIPFQPERFVRMFPSDSPQYQPGGPLYNRSRFEAVHVVPAPKDLKIDGDLSDWDRSGAFYSACFPPYHESHYVEGAMMYDDQFVYIGAHVGDPAPMRSKMSPEADPLQYAWRGGSVIVRLAVNPALGWPLDAMDKAEADSKNPQFDRRPLDVSEEIVHTTIWYHQPTGKARLHLSYGMDFHGEKVDPAGWRGEIRMDPNGLGYTVEYAIPWSHFNAAQRPPRAGDVLAATWTVHWSDLEGSRSRGHLVEITNGDLPPFRFLRGTTWGKAIFHEKGSLPPQTVSPRK